MSAHHAETEITIRNPQGLHGRPATELVKAAAAFESRIELVRPSDGHRADCGSVLNLMMLAATQGTVFRLVAEGPDAEEAVEKLARLVEEDLASH